MAEDNSTSLDGCPYDLSTRHGRYSARKAGWAVPYRYSGGIPRPFWSFVDRSGGSDSCWPWNGYRTRYGYGSRVVNGRWIGAHRLAWEEHHGQPAPPLLMHTCDNPPCCNPAHLVPGTHTDNMRDAIRKGRHCCGERHFNAKITAEIAAEILASGETSPVLGSRYGVNASVIRKVRTGRSWRHVPRPS